VHIMCDFFSTFNAEVYHIMSCMLARKSANC
jgi:hypothetical protein